jgi:unconventional prefoldin RPB5 interactor 1
MLQYGLSEVGAIVAEMDIEGRDDAESDEEMDDYDDYDGGFDTEESELEDERGRSLRPQISEEYRQQMLELEKKLNARMVENVGPRPDGHLAEYTNDLRTLKIKKDDSFETPTDSPADIPKEESAASSSKKGVRFASELDISPAPPPAKSPTITEKPAASSTSTISDTIVERAGPVPQPPLMEPSRPTKVSRFKSSRAATTPGTVLPLPAVPDIPPVPHGPRGQTLAGTIVEHDSTIDEPNVPDEFDPVTINREIQTQYHKMRNKMIQQQGGFKSTQEDDDHPLMEEVNGKEKKVSRFRAARLKQEGL